MFDAEFLASVAGLRIVARLGARAGGQRAAGQRSDPRIGSGSFALVDQDGEVAVPDLAEGIDARLGNPAPPLAEARLPAGQRRGPPGHGRQTGASCNDRPLGRRGQSHSL